jgi:hypothetical protein
MRHLMLDIARLHEAFGHPVRRVPLTPDEVNDAEGCEELQQRLLMRLRLVAEEFFELVEGALGLGGSYRSWYTEATMAMELMLKEWQSDYDYNAIETADALTDLVVVIVGMALELGIPLDRTWNEVQRSNMAKAGPDGKVTKREDGKVLKPEGWTPPDIKTIMQSDPPLPTRGEVKLSRAVILAQTRVGTIDDALTPLVRELIPRLQADLAVLHNALVVDEAMGRFVGEGSVSDDFDAPMELRPSKRCTCDDFCDYPCPVHHRENELQNEVIEQRNATNMLHFLLERENTLRVIEEAVRSFGGSDRVFNAAGFAGSARELSGIQYTLDGNVVRALMRLTGFASPLAGGAHLKAATLQETRAAKSEPHEVRTPSTHKELGEYEQSEYTERKARVIADLQEQEAQVLSPQKPLDKLVQKVGNWLRWRKSLGGLAPSTVAQRLVQDRMLTYVRNAYQEYEAERKKQEQQRCIRCGKFPVECDCLEVDKDLFRHVEEAKEELKQKSNPDGWKNE